MPTAQSATFTWAVPNNAAFAGLEVQSQVVQLELDAQGQFVAMNGSNALTLTLGSF